MQPDEAADILGDLPEERSRVLLDAMEEEEADEVRELLRFHDDSAGGVMTTEFFRASADWSVGETIEALRDVDPDLLGELGKLREAPPEPRDPAFPFVLSAGERRSFTANTIIRDPAWRKADAGGALRMCPEDARSLGVATGDRVRVSTRRDSLVAAVEVTDTMQPGHVSLPNGLGLSYPGDKGEVVTGVAPNELTATEDRDPFVGTPWHKHVPARVERA